MNLEAWGDVAIGVAGAGVVVFALLFLFCTRWWTDLLGRVIGGVLISAGVILTLVIVRLFGVPLPGINWWRLILYGGFGMAVWVGVGVFVWAQFFAPAVRKRRGVPSSMQEPDNERN